MKDQKKEEALEQVIEDLEKESDGKDTSARHENKNEPHEKNDKDGCKKDEKCGCEGNEGRVNCKNAGNQESEHCCHGSDQGNAEEDQDEADMNQDNSDEDQENPDKEEDVSGKGNKTDKDEKACQNGENGKSASAKKSFFGKKDKPDPMKAKIEEMQQKYLRQVAEFDNFRKRTDREKAQMFDSGAGNVIEKMLPVVDNFERGLANVPEDEKDGAFADGMNKIYKQLLKQLEDLGVKPIEALGKEFNPDFHNAVMQVESEDVESGYVAQELQKGYMFHDTVIRHSMVAVAK